MDNDKPELNLSIGDSNVKGLESPDNKDVKNRYNRVKGAENYATGK